LLPAFLIAGAMSAFIPKEMITRYLGRNTPKLSHILLLPLPAFYWRFVPARDTALCWNL
jgi:uncharacterized membrane protein YraQ (UPF0718 family)